jgi:tetratricopeptide (TPR) repeat protein
MLVEGHMVLGYSLAFLDDLNLGLEHLEKGIALYDPNKSSSQRFSLGSNPGVVSRNASALILWMLGFPDRALIRSREAVALALRLNHPYSIAYAQFHSGLLSYWRREPKQIEECSQAVLEIALEHEFQVWQAVATCLRGAALSGLGRAEQGLILIREGMDMYQGLNTPPIFWPMLVYMHAGVCWQVGEPAQGLSILEEGLQIGAQSSGRTLLPEFLRLHGELIYASRPEDTATAENQFLQALEAAQDLGARMMELRTAISLFRLWKNKGLTARGKRLLETVYDKFDEGFETADLLEASELLEKA